MKLKLLRGHEKTLKKEPINITYGNKTGCLESFIEFEGKNLTLEEFLGQNATLEKVSFSFKAWSVPLSEILNLTGLEEIKIQTLEEIVKGLYIKTELLDSKKSAKAGAKELTDLVPFILEQKRVLDVKEEEGYLFLVRKTQRELVGDAFTLFSPFWINTFNIFSYNENYTHKWIKF
jgi:hypothetical protein